MKIRVYRYEYNRTSNIFYRFRHPDEPAVEKISGIRKIEYEPDNGQVQTINPMPDYVFDGRHVPAMVFRCKNCGTNHLMLKDSLIPMNVHFANPCRCGNIGKDYYKAQGCLVANVSLPVYETITDYKYNTKHETSVDKLFDDEIYNNIVSEILNGLSG